MASKRLLLAALLAAVCAVIPHALSQSAPDGGDNLNVTVFVEGMVQVYADSVFTLDGEIGPAPPIQPEYTYTLVDKAVNDEPPNEVPVAFGEEEGASLTTGDIVQTALTLTLTAEQASELGFGFSDSSNGRRLLSEEHEKARRMVLDFHNTKRSLQEFISLTNVLGVLSSISLSSKPKAENPVLVSKEDSKDLFVTNGASLDVSSLTFVFRSTSCGLYPSINSSVVRKYWFNEESLNPKVTATLQRYHSACTYGRLTFTPINNNIYDVDIPCKGTLRGGIAYDLEDGTGNIGMLDGLMALVDLAKDYLRENDRDAYRTWKQYRRKIYIFPFGWKRVYNADFIGRASHGCVSNGNCFAFINSAPYGLATEQVTVPLVFHELGHNIGLTHAAAFDCTDPRCKVVEYGDLTDPMGLGAPYDLEKNLVCMSAPQAYKAGWASPIPGGHIAAGRDLPPGIAKTFTLPSMSLGSENMLRIITDAANTALNGSATTTRREAQRALFVSFRIRGTDPASYDSGLGRDNNIYFDLNNYVWVHEFNETANGMPGVRHSLLLAKLDNKAGKDSFTQVLSTTLGGVTVRVKSKTAKAATVTVCRFLRTNESGSSCSDGLDNDCDGLVDMDDPDCNPALRPSPPPPSPPPKKQVTQPPPAQQATSGGGPAKKPSPSPPPAHKLKKPPTKAKSPPPKTKKARPPPKKNTNRG
ncbi:hypothetical protein VOLCADRAFT_94248 [Volvox carteri f. nagariensis]|uniref:Peptidase M11 gametolysin domain-containing protein n=1 Tax=Volvox carteri f. nagariensis TaxID=3068 RepID=D8U404_VOLCA|nr:uncharacterized protein VOLCADRAFT_94248 [Volvox carteri f. nagariensis]EFJ45511.1 hypothetical protein VOLCADRAFT_94248 [Volvox carteri f. nagariensis]|eukprot:XP_002953538.1 hypothetical protein VOLCADRAFT_94248 [Volvox carteri f. nagariensis]